MENSLRKTDQTNAQRPMLRFLLATGLVVLLLLGLVNSSRQPVYEGKTIAEWFKESAAITDSLFSSRGASALAAFEHFGARAQPFILHWAQRRPPLLAKIHDRWLVKLPNWMQKALPTIHSQQWYIERRRFALQMLGFVEEWERTRPGGNIHAACHVGTNALPVFIEALGDRDPLIRLIAVISLGRLGDKAWLALPTLVKSMSDVDLRVAIASIQTIGRMGPCATNVVRLLAAIALDSTNPLRKEAVKALGEIGPAARGAGSVLVSLFEEDAPSVQAQTTAANLFRMADDNRVEILAPVVRQFGRLSPKSDAVSGTPPSQKSAEVSKSELSTSTVGTLTLRPAPSPEFAHKFLIGPKAIVTAAGPPFRQGAQVPQVNPPTTSSNPKAVIPNDRALQELVAETLVKIGGIPDETAPVLQHLVASEGPGTRVALAVALWQRNPDDPTLQTNLISTLRSEDWLYKVRAIRLLSGLGTNAAVFLPELRRLFEDRELMVRMSATTAVRRVSLSTP